MNFFGTEEFYFFSNESSFDKNKLHAGKNTNRLPQISFVKKIGSSAALLLLKRLLKDPIIKISLNSMEERETISIFGDLF
jgi:hypothetical protein